MRGIMAIRKLHETLEELHRQLDDANSLDPHEREHLVATMREIRETLERASGDGDTGGEPPTHAEDATSIDRLGDFVKHFEAEHPTISARLSQLIVGLNKIGF